MIARTRVSVVVGFVFFVLSLVAAESAPVFRRLDGRALTAQQIDSEVTALMRRAQVPGLGIALIADGKVAFAKGYGWRDVATQARLESDTIMYGASLTKTAVAYMVMQLVDEGLLDLDKPIGGYLKQPLPQFPKYADLAGDPRWEQITARMLLSHTAGFPNFRFVNPDGKLDLKFEPGARYAYSGEGINLMQFVLEMGLGLDVGREMQKRVFDRFGMKRTSMTWRADFAANHANGYDATGKMEPHDQRESVRAAGSMDTTISDYAKFIAGFMRGEGLSAKSKAEILRPQIAISSAHQFPTLLTAANPANQQIGLSAGLGLVVFNGPQGAVWHKGGHNDTTDNLVIVVEDAKRAILLLSNSVRTPAIFPALTEALLGDAGMPWNWEYNPLPPLPPDEATRASP